MSEEPPVSELALERHRLGELPPDEAEALRRRLATDAALRRRLAELEASDRDLLERYPIRRTAAAVRERLETRAAPGAGGGRLAWAAAAVGVALLAILLPAGLREQPRVAPAEEGVRIKGLAPVLSLYRRAGDGAEALPDGALAREGDLIRLAYRAGGHAYGAILSVDGRGGVTLHLPDRDGPAARLEPAGTVPLDYAYELDDAPGFERFYLVAGDTAFALEPILGAARRVAAQRPGRAPGRLPLPDGLWQSGVTLRKETGR